MGGRRYHQYCPVARALDVVGDRWTLLIARELLLGPRRFTDLAEGLPGIGSSVLTTRLKEMERRGLIAKRNLPSTADCLVYDPTEEGRGMGPVLREMTKRRQN